MSVLVQVLKRSEQRKPGENIRDLNNKNCRENLVNI